MSNSLVTSVIPNVNGGASAVGGSTLVGRAVLQLGETALGRTASRMSEENRAIDRSLVKRAKRGDRDAFRDLVERYEQRILNVAIGIVGNYEDARDLVQEAFLKAYRNISSFREQSSFYTWLYRILANLAIDLSRKKSRQVESSVGEQSVLDHALQHSSLGDSSPMGSVEGPEDHLERAELRSELKRAIEALSEEHRVVIVLREIEGLSYAEISDVVGCSKGTVMSRLHHARKKLQKILSRHSSEGGRGDSDEFQGTPAERAFVRE